MPNKNIPQEIADEGNKNKNVSKKMMNSKTSHTTFMCDKLHILCDIHTQEDKYLNSALPARRD